MENHTNGIQQKSCFSRRLGFYTLFWIFVIGCFLGVMLEIAWFFINHHYYENRSGLVYGPFNLVYGLGALGMTICLNRVSKRGLWWLFLGGCIVGSAFEFLCSWVQESMFGTVSWDYRAESLNLNGRIHLSLSLIWGILGVVWMKWLCPSLCIQLQRVPDALAKPATWIMLVFMIFNITVSAIAADRMTERHHGIPPENGIEQWVDETFPDTRMEKIFANLMFVEGDKRIPIQNTD
ncbi:putative ABC transporter permease [Massiliimalia massiliensis]|uniref:putative ABC transporter permease n=1 Tax=Massiliimalia massiliensis TaxID=1852384 RepID=UPI000986B1BA|nr:putative ABC transporter permease [Massiliimalia massiliensis]